VLEEALNPDNPLLERLKFFCITSSNLDEFFEVRVAGLKQQIETSGGRAQHDGLTPAESSTPISKRVRRLVADQYRRCWRNDLMPALAKNGIRILDIAELGPADLKWVRHIIGTRFVRCSQPLAIDPAHPFPQLLNKSLNLIVGWSCQKNQEVLKHMAVVQIPRNQPRLVKFAGARMRGGIMCIWAG